MLADKSWSPEPTSLASRGNVEQGFIDAAASAPALDPAQVAVAREIAARRRDGDAPEPVAAARLAWVLIDKTKDPDLRKEGLDLVRKAAAANPTKDEERRELANVLAGAKEFRAAADILVPAIKTVDDRIKLVDLYSGARQWDLAEQELNKIRQDPNTTPEQKVKVDRELAKVLAWSGKHAEALTLIGDILKQNPDDKQMRVFQADVNVWAKNLDTALALYLPLVKQYPDDPEVAVGFANAAAKSKAPITEEATGQLLRLADRAASPDAKDPLLVARVAEAYATRLQEKERGRQLAQKAARMDPKDPIVRREVAFALASPDIGLYKEADVLFTGMELTGDERKQYVFIASQAENYEAARRQARLYLAEQVPGSLKEREARRLLADVLTWKGDYEEALALYERLAEGQPKDRDLRVEIAQVYRYWQNYPMALAKFAELVGEDLENRALWIGLIDAASSAGKARILPQKELLLQIYDKLRSTDRQAAGHVPAGVGHVPARRAGQSPPAVDAGGGDQPAAAGRPQGAGRRAGRARPTGRGDPDADLAGGAGQPGHHRIAQPGRPADGREPARPGRAGPGEGGQRQVGPAEPVAVRVDPDVERQVREGPGGADEAGRGVPERPGGPAADGPVVPVGQGLHERPAAVHRPGGGRRTRSPTRTRWPRRTSGGGSWTRRLGRRASRCGTSRGGASARCSTRSSGRPSSGRTTTWGLFETGRRPTTRPRRTS